MVAKSGSMQSGMYEATSVQDNLDEIEKQWRNSTVSIGNKGSVNQLNNR